MSLKIYLNDEIQTPKGKIRAAGVIAKETKKAGSRSGSAFFVSGCVISSWVLPLCGAAAKYKCCGVAVLLCYGRKEAGMRVEVRGRRRG